MHIYIYMYIYVCMCVCVWVCGCQYAHIHLQILCTRQKRHEPFMTQACIFLIALYSHTCNANTNRNHCEGCVNFTPPHPGKPLTTHVCEFAQGLS